MNPYDNNQNQQNKLDPSLGYLLSILRDIPILNSVPTGRKTSLKRNRLIRRSQRNHLSLMRHPMSTSPRSMPG